MKRASLLLTGGTGFIGKSILQRMLDSPIDSFELTILSRDAMAFMKAHPQFQQLENLRFLHGDIRSFTFPRTSFDFIIHAATPASVKLEQDQPEEMYSIIVDGTRHLLDFAARCGCKRLLFLSSGAVYGPQPRTLARIPESHPCLPVLAYGKGKLLAEQLCTEAGTRHGFIVSIARCFAFVGPFLPLDVHFAIGNFMRDCLLNRPISINGDGTPLRSYLYADDLVDWLFSILAKGIHGRPYNVGSSEPISIADLAYRVRLCAQTTNAIEIKGQPVPGQAAIRYVPDVDRIQHELGVKQTVSLDDAIRRTLAWHRENG